MSSANFYAQALANAFKGNISIGTSVIKAGLLKSTHTLDLINDQLWSDVSADESSGTNYTAGGITVGTPALPVTAADSWTTTAATTTAYTVGQVVRPTVGNGSLYRCEAAGTSGGSAPSFPATFGATVADGTVTWSNIGRAIIRFTCDPLVYNNITITDFRYVVFYDSTSGYLIAVHDLGTTENVSNTNFTFTPDATGVVYQFVQ